MRDHDHCVSRSGFDRDRWFVGTERFKLVSQCVKGVGVDVVVGRVVDRASQAAVKGDIRGALNVVDNDIGPDRGGSCSGLISLCSGPESEVENHMICASCCDAGPEIPEEFVESRK